MLPAPGYDGPSTLGMRHWRLACSAGMKNPLARFDRDGERHGARAPEAKASKAGAMIALHSAGRPVWTPRNYAALARAGYMRNPVVYRAVRMVAEAAASLPWLLYDGAAELDDHPLLALLQQAQSAAERARSSSRRSTGTCSSPATPMSRR